jgi:hypothetical protein
MMPGSFGMSCPALIGLFKREVGGLWTGCPRAMLRSLLSRPFGAEELTGIRAPEKFVGRLWKSLVVRSLGGSIYILPGILTRHLNYRVAA